MKKKQSEKLFLVLIVSMTFWAGAMAFYDFPQVYADFIMEYFDIDTVKLEYLYSFIYIPNIFLALIATFVVNRLGFANGVIIC